MVAELGIGRRSRSGPVFVPALRVWSEVARAPMNKVHDARFARVPYSLRLRPEPAPEWWLRTMREAVSGGKGPRHAPQHGMQSLNRSG